MVLLTHEFQRTVINILLNFVFAGCTPKSLSVFDNAPPAVKDKIMLYRTPNDFERLKHYADEKKVITIIGNGFIGSELACSLANYAKGKGLIVNQVFPEDGNMWKILSDYLSKCTTNKIQELRERVYVLSLKQVYAMLNEMNQLSNRA